MIPRLLTIKELGEVEREVVLKEFHSEVRKGVRNISNVAGLRTLFYFPYAQLRNVTGLARNNAQNDALKSSASQDTDNSNGRNGSDINKKGPTIFFILS